MSSDRRTILSYYAYKATTSNGFWMPYAYVYLQQQGYGPSVFGLANAAFLFTMVVMEIPAGYIGDRLGRRVSLGVGNVLAAGVFTLYAFTTAEWHVVALFAAWGIGYAFHSATGEAWLYDLLDGERDRSDANRFAHFSGRSETVALAVSAAGALAATPLYWVDPAFPFLANATLSAAGVPLLAVLPSTRTELETRFSVRKAIGTLRTLSSRPEIRWLVAYVALFNLLFSMTRWLEQPSLESSGVPLVGFGVLYAAFQLVSAAGTSTTGWIQENIGAERFFLLLVPVCGLVYGAVAVVPMFIIPVIFLRRTLGRIVTPIRDQYLNDRLNEGGRATALSGVSMVLSTTSAFGNAVVGPIAETMGPISFLPIAGVLVSVAAIMLWLGTSPIRPRANSVTTVHDRSSEDRGV